MRPPPRARSNAPFYLLIVGAYAFVTVARMAQPGMFLDGVIYASISRNLAEGRGSFWSPPYTATEGGFYEHPPLGFVLQSVGFRLFGDHLAVERAYSVLVGGLTGVLIVLIWRRSVAARAHDWLPVVFWLLPSIVTWSIVNNLLETTQTLFTTGAVLAHLLSVQSGRVRYGYAVLSGLCVWAAVLTKGPTGFFPLAAPLVAAMVLPLHRPGALRSGMTMLGTLVAAAGLTFSSAAARLALSTYWNVQVMESISGARGGGRWSSISRHLAGGILLRMGGLLLLSVLPRVFRRSAAGPLAAAAEPWPIFFLLLAVAASVPVAVSARVSGHYLVPAVPMYALAFGALALPLIQPWLDRSRTGWPVRLGVGGVGAVLLIASVAIPVSGRVVEPRDAAWIAEYRSLAPALPRDAVIGTCEALREEWGVHAYLQRFFRISLDVGPEQPRRYHLGLTDRQCDVPGACREVLATARMMLSQCP